MKDKIIKIVNSPDGYIYGLSESGNLYRIDPLVKKTWELVQYPPFIQEVKKDERKTKR